MPKTKRLPRAKPRLYLGIDGGQSSTSALIADEGGRILGAGKGGPCNHVGADEQRAKFLSGVGSALENACAHAKLPANRVEFAAVCLGLSGGAEGKEVYARELIRSARFKFTHDADIALLGALAGEPGIIVIAGTGSMAFGRSSTGETARAGGWGYIYGDEGSAFDLTRRALRAALQHEEGWGHETHLRSALLEATGANSANELLHRFYTAEFPRAVVAAFAPLVDQTAEAGDRVAGDLIRQAAKELVGLAVGVHHCLHLNDEVRIAPIGGAFKSRTLLRYFEEEVALIRACRVQQPCFNPAAGAVIQALRLDGNKSALSGVPASIK